MVQGIAAPGQLHDPRGPQPGREQWSLPKGRAEPGESAAGCAAREVGEETGVLPRVHEEAVTLARRDRSGRRRLVSWWVMTPAEDHVAGQKAMGVMAAALAVHGRPTAIHVALGVRVAAAVALAVGTAIGGQRVIPSVSRRLYRMNLVDGVAMQVSAALVILLEWRPNADLATMATAGTEAMTCLRAAIATLHDDHEGALEPAKRATKLANAIEHHYRLAFRSALDHSVTADSLAAIDAYRRTADLAEAIRRVAQRTAYTLVKER